MLVVQVCIIRILGFEAFKIMNNDNRFCRRAIKGFW